jgi:uncharacterized protein YjbI with pentapeptide repeats
MVPTRWLPLLLALLFLPGTSAVGQGRASEDAAGPLQALRERMAALRQSIEAWRRSPYENLEQGFTARVATLQRQLDELEARVGSLLSELRDIERVPGPAGPPGRTGPAGLPGNLQLAGEICPAGEAVTGFDAFGNVLCTESARASSAGVGVDCPAALVSTADLRRCDLRGQSLADRDLSFATLVMADLRGTLEGTLLRGADMRNAELTGAVLRGVNLSYANLTFARMGSVRIEGGDLTGAVLRRAELSLSRTLNARLAGADFTDASLVLSQHVGSDFTRANLSGADLRQAVFENASLFLAVTSSSLEQARLINSICPDGYNSSQNGDSCIGHRLP